jgi:hypothetical protein
MTFTAMPAWGALLLVAAAIAAAALLFRLKVRPPRIRVPSLLFWTKVLSEKREQTFWERIRRAVSLAVTIAIAAAIALAFTRPTAATNAAAARRAGTPVRLLVAIDSSWSMLAKTRSGETRWDRALAEARRLAATASPGAEVAIATTGEGLLEAPTSDVTVLDAALDRAAPSGAGKGWPTVPGATVHFITDGATPRAISSDVVVHSVYEAADNAGITAFDVRPALDGTHEDEAYLEIANFGQAQQVHLAITRGAATVLDRTLDLGAAQSVRQIVRLPRGAAADVRARIDASHDALALDNDAYAWIADARPLNVAVVGAQTAWMNAWFRANPDVSGTFTDPDGYKAGSEDVVIFDRYAPAADPVKPALYIAPPASEPLGLAGADVEMKPKWSTSEPHPLLDGVDPLTFSIERAHALKSPRLHAIAQSAAGTPLVSVGTQADRPRVVVLSFGPQDSNLAEAPAFPILMGNAVDWLARASAGPSRRTGRALFNASIVRVKGPAGDDTPLLNLHGEPAALLTRPGIYTAEASGGAAAKFAVNVVDPDVSNTGRTTLGSGGLQAIAVTAGVSGHPWWMYLVALAFAAALLEWWTWLRRITV